MARATRLITATRRLINSPEGETSDWVLIDRFAQARDEQAFAELVERHGPLVHSACRRLLRDAATADDVFQATFLVLAQQAGRANWRTTIGPWLYTIAVRLARKAQSRRTGAPLDTATAAELAAPAADPSEPLVWDEVKGALDDELAQLPTALSQPLVLCYLQGLTRDEAARLLGVSLAKLKRNLNRGRNLLRDRLSRRGITLAAAGWGIALTSPPLSAEMRQRVIRSACDATQATTTPAAVQELIVGCTRSHPSRWLLAPVVLAVGLSVTALGFALRPAEPPPALAATKPVEEKPAPDAVAQKEAPMDPLPDGAVMRFGSPRLLDSNGCPGAFSPDGKLFATGLCVWDAATGKLVRSRQNPFTVLDLRWRADGLAAVTYFTSSPDVFLMQLFGEEKGTDFRDERLSAERRAIADNPPRDRLEWTSVFLSGDGKWVFAEMVSQDGKARRLERFPFTANKTSATVKPDRALPYSGGRSGAWAGRDGQSGAWASRDGRTVVLLEPAAGEKPARLLAYDLTAEKYDQPVWEKKVPAGKKPLPAVQACLTIDGKRVVILYADGAVEVWDGPAGKRIRYYDDNLDTRGMDLTPDGKRVAMLFRNPVHEIGGRVIEVETGKEVCTLAPQPFPSYGGMARISPDGKQVAQVAVGVARIWNAETGAPAVPLPGHNGRVTALLPTADGKGIISAGADHTLREWNPQTGKETWRTTFANWPVPRFVTPEGVVVQEYKYNIWGDPEPGLLLTPKTGKREPLPGALGAAKTPRPNAPNYPPIPDVLLAQTPDGKTVVTLAQHAPALRTWAWPSGEPKTTCPITPPQGLTFFYCEEAHVTPDGKQLVALMRYVRSSANFQEQPVFVERWDLVSGKMLARADGGSDLSPPKLIPYADGVLILDVLDGFSETVTGGLFTTVPGGFNNMGNLTLPRGPQTKFAGELRDTVSGVRVVRLTLSKELPDFQRVRTGALSPDGRVLALGTDYGTVWLFEMRTGKHFRALHPEGRTHSVLRFLPDGRLVTASDTALVWPTGLQEAEGTEELATLWAEFADSDPMKARPAMAKMAGRGARAVEFIRGRVQPVPKLKADVEQIVKALGSGVLKERAAASAALDKLGASAVAAVQAQLRADVSDEVRTRAKRFLDKYDSGFLRPEELQVLRAIEVLEVIGGADARAALEALAAGESSARATCDAAGAVRRLNGTPPAKNAR